MRSSSTEASNRQAQQRKLKKSCLLFTTSRPDAGLCLSQISARLALSPLVLMLEFSSLIVPPNAAAPSALKPSDARRPMSRS